MKYSIRKLVLWGAFALMAPALFGQTFREGATAMLLQSGSLRPVGEGRVVQVIRSSGLVQGAYVAGFAQNTLQLQVVNAQQEVQWVMPIPHVPDAHFPSVAIGERRAVLVRPEIGHVTFYNEKGEGLERVYLFNDQATRPELEKAAHVVMDSASGRIVIVAMQRATYDVAASGNLRLFVFNKDGKRLVEHILPLPAIESLKPSEDGKSLNIRQYGHQADRVLMEEVEMDWSGQVLNTDRSSYVVPNVPQRMADITFPYPIKPFNEPHPVTGAFGEYRGPTDGHFHNGTDVPEVDGSPVYAVLDATVTGRSDTGVNAYIRAGNYVYVHIVPNPALSIGSSVKAGETVLGTIIAGQGHVHFSEGPPGNYTNAIRPTGGFSPFADTWKPSISEIRFQHAEAGQILQPTGLTGKIKITFRVQDPIGPPTGSAATQNNGAYIVGYDVRKRDRTTVVHSPSSDGVVFRFEGIPSDDYVHFVYDQSQSSNSSHVYIVTNSSTAAGAWDTTKLPDGEYTVRLFARDSRGNEDVVFQEVRILQRDIIPPSAPVWLLTGLQGEPKLSWVQAAVPDLVGFRLFVADTPFATGTQLLSEQELSSSVRTHALSEAPKAQYYYLASVDNATPPNVSVQSDVYGRSPYTGNKKILVVDGFDRFGGSGSWAKPFHVSAGIYGQAIDRNGLGFETVANEAVVSGLVDMKQYDAVMWVLGDESTTDETFSDAEQLLIRAYLENGGRLFVSGSEVAWDLGSKGTPTDQAFLGQFLKTAYAGDNAANYEVRGITGTLAEGLSFRYGASPYTEDYPDFINSANGGQTVLQYGNGRIAGVAYSGTFGSTSKVGKMVYFAFPFDTIDTLENRREVFRRVLSFLLDETISPVESEAIPHENLLAAAYPNPFFGVAHFHYIVPKTTSLRISVYDILGREVQKLYDAPVAAGSHTLNWQPENVASGLYFVMFQTDTGLQKIRLTYLR
ncbi:MAG: T9SS type A sorting domain-containing protein [Bacteroidetes Order II. Incertae sedis bacterium]|nr:T9SS type A sorting domain-containing protein [Bacteroidetes Order II. bacterium]